MDLITLSLAAKTMMQLELVKRKSKNAAVCNRAAYQQSVLQQSLTYVESDRPVDGDEIVSQMAQIQAVGPAVAGRLVSIHSDTLRDSTVP